MACCGRTRAQLFATGTNPIARESPSTAMRRYSVQFEYIGQTALTAFGSASGRRYRFDRPGAIVTIDPRDRPGLAQVPGLRLI